MSAVRGTVVDDSKSNDSLTHYLYRNCELVDLKCQDLTVDDAEAVEAVFVKYLRGEELTLNNRDVHFKVHLNNRKGWQKKSDKGIRGADLRRASKCL